MANEFQHKDPGTALTQAEYITTDGTGHIFDCQATGDIMYASSATVLKNLGKGAANTVLSMGGSCIPAWTASPSVTDLTIGGGCITLSAATDIDLLDNNASALSFDSTGKTGIIDIVTTDCSEGVTMSGTLGVTGVLTATGGFTSAAASTITIDADSEFIGLKLTNQSDAADTTGFVTLAFDLEDTGGNAVDAGKISVKKEASFTATASSQDSKMEFQLSENGTLAEKMTLSSTGALSIDGALSIGGSQVLSGSALASAVKLNNCNWSGADLGVANGGTNLSVYAVGDVVYASGTTTIAKLAKPGTPAGEVLTFAACASAPSWAAAAGGGSLTLLDTTAVSGCPSTLGVACMTSTYDTYLVAFSDITVNCTASMQLRLGDSGGIDSGASDYAYHAQSMSTGSSSYAGCADASNSFISITPNGIGNCGGEGIGGMFWIHQPGDGTAFPYVSGEMSGRDNSCNDRIGNFYGRRTAVITTTQVQLSLSTGSFKSGRLTVWGLAHA
jgi:hypothetical protein